jgi:hypothetical protein
LEFVDEKIIPASKIGGLVRILQQLSRESVEGD